MRAVRIHARRDMRTEQVPSPVPAAGEVRLRVRVQAMWGFAGRICTMRSAPRSAACRRARARVRRRSPVSPSRMRGCPRRR
jgi:hypothetical protein